MFNGFLFSGVILLAIIGLLSGAKIVQIRDLISAGESMVPPPPAVSSTKAVQAEWEVSLNSVGSLESSQGVVLTADVPGRVTDIMFESGASVVAGEKLVQLDISVETAQLRSALASVELAEADLKRLRELREKRVASQSELDVAEASYKQSVAQADNIRAAIAKKTVVAPFAGKLGIREINLGQDLAMGAPIVSLQSNTSMLVNFSLPQKDLGKLSPGLPVRLTIDSRPDAILEARITAINPNVDRATRNVRVQATLNATQDWLAAGMYAEVEVILPQANQVLYVPITAISFATFGNSVYVIEEETDKETGETRKIARQQFVQLGRQRGDFVDVSKGLESGKDVVTSGLFKLFNGTPVTVNNDVMPEFSLTPNPDDT